MFVELAEYLLCNGDHEPTYLVLTPDRVEGRAVIEGTVGCPRCRREYRIKGGLVRFLPAGWTYTPPSGRIDAPAPTVQALMGVTGPGGYVVLLGSACTLAPELAALMEGIHVVAVNPPAELDTAPDISRLCASDHIPLRSSMARAVVVGPEHATEPWLADAVRVLLRGLRLVILAEGPEPRGAEALAVGQGMWVGQKA